MFRKDTEIETAKRIKDEQSKRLIVDKNDISFAALHEEFLDLLA